MSPGKFHLGKCCKNLSVFLDISPRSQPVEAVPVMPTEGSLGLPILGTVFSPILSM